MASELLVIVLVALIVFGPNKLPMLAAHLAKALQKLHALKTEANLFWQGLLAEQELQENQKRAEAVEEALDPPSSLGPSPSKEKGLL